MGRRKSVKDLRGVDPDSQTYWNEQLQRAGLSMESGRNRKLTYVGQASSLEYIEGVVSSNTGRVEPKKAAE